MSNTWSSGRDTRCKCVDCGKRPTSARVLYRFFCHFCAFSLESSWLPRSELTSCAQVVKEYNDSFAQLCASHDEQSFNDERCSVCLLPFDSLAFATKHMCGSIMHQTCVIRCKQIQTDFKCPLCQIHIESNKEFSEGIATFNCDMYVVL